MSGLSKSRKKTIIFLINTSQNDMIETVNVEKGYQQSMKKIAVVTDSNSGITQEEAKQLGVFVLPMPFMIDDAEYFEGINLTVDEFFEKLKGDCKISTSQPAVGAVTDLWDEVLKDYDQLIHIPMSSGLSNSCQTALMLSNEDEYQGKVFVVNNQRVSVTQKQSVRDALYLISEGKDGREIRDILERDKMLSSIYITVDTLSYLKKGGRLTPAVAAIGTLLRIKPVLQSQGEKLDTYSKARTMKQAKSIMINAIKTDIENRFAEFPKDKCVFSIAHTDNFDAAVEFRREIVEALGGIVSEEDIEIDNLSLSVSCHIGPGALACTCTIKE